MANSITEKQQTIIFKQDKSEGAPVPPVGLTPLPSVWQCVGLKKDIIQHHVWQGKMCKLGIVACESDGL